VRYLLDTNIISEIRKGSKCDPKVAAWFAGIEEDEVFLSALVLGEIRRGIELARARTPEKAAALETWLNALVEGYGDRVLPVDWPVAEAWGRMAAKRTVSTVDALLAATARVHDLTLVTRNTSDVADLDAALLNPFET
jgi:predicted nucleic acid-binding protein